MTEASDAFDSLLQLPSERASSMERQKAARDEVVGKKGTLYISSAVKDTVNK